uniref:Uncharacterized protein n=1 Tax=Arundo donax TaxID=35708 RepID=A0A0A8XNW5_ARUDO
MAWIPNSGVINGCMVKLLLNWRLTSLL